MGKFLKDKKIDILLFDPKTEEHIAVKTGAWAYVRHLSGNEQYLAGIAENGKRNYLFIINKPRFELTNVDRILYKGVEYDITNVDDYDGRTGELKVYASGNYPLIWDRIPDPITEV